MGYVPLNRRHRPRSFEEVTRQEHVTRTLQNAMRQGRLAQAYLFGGRRGTGKTTMARILAMGLNCKKPGTDGPTPEPCGVCESCASIREGTSPDVIELDAASNRGIDEIRALQENVRLAPMSGRYKVYIIDEAHQMTKDAYNAFLKTLEEPPPHVVFILATTEPEKIIPTVRSRCQRFDFRPVPERDIAERLRAVAQAEGFHPSDDLLVLIARKAEGSLRDALGLLEQCVAFAGESPTVQDFLTVTGGLDRDALRRLATLTAEGRGVDVVAHLDAMLRAGRDPAAVLDGLVAYLRDVFLTGLRLAETRPAGSAAAAAAPGETAGPPDPELAAEARAWPAERLVTYIDALVKAGAEMRYSPQPRLILEMALLGLALGPGNAVGPSVAPPSPAAAAGPGPAPVQAPRPASSAGPDPETSTPGPAPSPAPSTMPTAAPVASPAAAPRTGPAPYRPSAPAALTAPGPEGVSLPWLRDNWEELLNRIRKKSVFLRAFLLKATPAGFADGVVTLSFETKFHKERFEEEKNRVACEEALSEAAGVPLRIRCRLNGNGNGNGSGNGSGYANGNGGGNGSSPGGEPEPPPPTEEWLAPRAEPPRPAPRPAAAPGPRPGAAAPGPRSAPAAPGPRPAAASPGPRPSATSPGSRPATSPGPRPAAGPAGTPAPVAPAPVQPAPKPPASTTGQAAPTRAPVSPAVSSALSIFGGRVVDDSPGSKPPKPSQ